MMKIDFLRLEKQTTEKGDGWAGCLDFDLFSSAVLAAEENKSKGKQPAAERRGWRQGLLPVPPKGHAMSVTCRMVNKELNFSRSR